LEKALYCTIIKSKGDVQEYRNNIGIMLMSQSINIWKKVIEKKIKIKHQHWKIYLVLCQNSVFQLLFCVRKLVEKNRKNNIKLYIVFKNLKKLYVRTPKELTK